MATSKPHSWWLNSHFSSRNSKWLSDNLHEIDFLADEMLKLIKEDGDSFAKKAQMYYQRRPELISHVEEFYRLYHVLAERYDSLIGELAKNIPNEFLSQSSVNGSELGTEEAASSTSPSSPDRKSNYEPNDLKPQCIEEGSFDHSREGSDESLSEAGSCCDHEKAMMDDYEDSSKLETRIFELEHELFEVRDKLNRYENGLKEHLNLASSTLSLENQPLVVDRKEEIENIGEAMEDSSNQFEAEISWRDAAINEYRTLFTALLNKLGKIVSAGEKAEDEQISELEVNTITQKKMAMEAESKLSSLISISSYESKLRQFEEKVKRLESEKSELNKKLDILTSEKAELNDQVINLLEGTRSWDDESRMIDEQLREQQKEHEKLIQEVEEARMASSELTSRVRELEGEVERQRDVIIDCAEGKKEAIRHLCFYLDHYREGYLRLRNVLQTKMKGLRP